MRKTGLCCFIFSAAATSASAATASNLYSASIRGTLYLRSRSEKIGSTFRLLVMTFFPISKGRKVSSKERGTPSAKRTRRILTTRSPFVSASWLANRRIGSHNFFTNYAGRWLAAKSVHILHKTAQCCKFLRDLWRSDECAFAATNLDKAAAHKILNRPADGNAADPESRDKAVFRRELVAHLQFPIGDFVG